MKGTPCARTRACCLGSFVPSTLTRAHASQYYGQHSFYTTPSPNSANPLSSTLNTSFKQWVVRRSIGRSIFNRMRQDRTFTDEQLQTKKAKTKVVKYVADMKLPQFLFIPAGHCNKCHGDNKSTTGGKLVTLCQLTVRYLPERQLATLILARQVKSRSIW